jgi:virginiamycin B lyase
MVSHGDRARAADVAPGHAPPATEQFTSFPLPSTPGDVRQILGRAGEVWGAESAADKLVVIRT